MELIQKQSNQEPRGNVYLEKGPKKRFPNPWWSGVLQGLYLSFQVIYDRYCQKEAFAYLVSQFALKFHSEALILG